MEECTTEQPCAGCGAAAAPGAKLERLRARLREAGSAAVAFSAGVDSTFLLHEAHAALGARAAAVTIDSRMVPRREMDEAAAFCRALGVRHEIIAADELEIPGFADNPPDRCYLCKKNIFSKIVAFARRNGFAVVMEGSNADDAGDFRPGMRAVRELGVASPLRDAGLTKAEIRGFSRAAGLATWRKPSAACLASRFPYGGRITPEAIERVERAERWLADAFGETLQMRVRAHGGLARIEVQADALPLVAARAAETAAAFKGFGFAHATLDLAGYRTGSMNEALTPDERKSALEPARGAPSGETGEGDQPEWKKE